MLRHSQNLLDDAKCVDTGRQRRWAAGVVCPHGGASHVTTPGRDETQPARQRYPCQACQTQFDDLTGTLCAGHHQPLRVWMLCRSCMGLQLSHAQLAQARDVPPNAVQSMASQRREGLVQHQPDGTRMAEVEGDAVSVVAGHQGHPEAVKKTAGPPEAAG